MHITAIQKIAQYLLISCVVLFFSPAWAEDDFGDSSNLPEEDSVSETRWYQIELLVYRQNPLATDIPEVWPKNINLAYPDNWVLLQTSEQYLAQQQKKAAVNTPYIFLDKKLPAFSSLEKKLQLNRNNILFHGVWRQSLKQTKSPDDDESNPAILIRGGKSYDDHYELEGSVSFQLARYLHIKTNLWLSRFIAATPATSNPAIETGEANLETAPEAWPSLPVFPVNFTTAHVAPADPTQTPPETPSALPQYTAEEIVLNQQSRRMRSYEMHYIDHPKMGVVVQLTPLDENTMLAIPKK